MSTADPWAEFEAAPASDAWAEFTPANERQRTAVRASAMSAATTPPDTAASAARLGRQAGLPLDLVQRNLPQVQQIVTADRIDRDTAGAPVLRERYAEPAFAAIAHDDSAALAHVERTASSYTFGNALKKGAAGVKLTLDFLADQLARGFGADRTETQRILRETGSFYTAQGTDPELQAAGQRAKEAGGGTWYGTLLHLPGEVADAQDPIGVVGRFMTEQLPGSLLGFGVGAAATAPVRATIATRVANEMVARGASMAVAGAAGNGTAVVVSALGANYQEGLGQGLPAEQAASRAWTKTLAEVPANAVAGAAMGLKIGPGQLTNIIGQAGVQGAGGGTGAAMAAQAVGEEADPVEIALEILGEAVSAGPEVAGLTYSRIAGSRATRRADAAQAAVADAQQVGEILKAADASALKQRDPQTLAEIVEQAQPEAVVYVEPEHLAGVDLIATPEVAAQLAEAQATGGDVQIPLGDLAAHLPGEQLLPHVRTEPEAMTLAEAQQFDGAAELAAEVTGPALDGALLTSPEQLNLDADSWTLYQNTAAEAAQAAIEQRDARALRDMQWLANTKNKALASVAQQAQAARTTIEAEVAAQVRQQPIYAAQAWLKTGVLPDGTQTVGAKLNTAALREIYGEGAAAPWRYLPTNMVAAGDGLHPDVVAEMFGFDSGDALVRALLSAEPEAQVVEGLTDARMLEEHPDIADTIARERSAEALIADRARERFLATEAEALARAVGSRVLLTKEAREYAAQSIARRAIRSVRPAQFKAAAARAGRAAAEAFHAGDTVQAAKRKQSEVLQTALQTEATSTTAEVAQALTAFKRIARAGNDGSRDASLANTARAILAQYGLARVDKTAETYLEQVKRYDLELHADLQVLMEGMPAPVADHRDMTVADFRTMRDRVQAVWSLARSTREIEIDGQKVEIARAAAALAEQLAFEPAAKREQMVGTNNRLDLRMRLASVRAALRRVEFWADARDKGDRNGPFRTYVWQPVSEAVTRYRGERNKYVNRFLALLKTIEPTLKPGKIAAPELGDGMVFADRSALLHALLHTGNESNRKKLLLGYQWATEREDGSLDATRWDGFLRRMHDEGRITAADWQFVQGTWNLLEEMKPAAQAAHKRMFGHFFAEITADPVQTPFGELAGGYVPALTDSLLVPEARTHGAMDDMLAGQNSPMFPAVGRGFTKGRVEDYTRPLALDLRLLPAHIDKVARFATLGPVLRDTARLVTRNKTFRAAMDAVDPTAIESMLVPWLKRVATQTLTKPAETQAGRFAARLANPLRNRTGLLLMAGNVVNVLQQVTSMSVAALRVKPRHLAVGLAELVRHPVISSRAINELSPWMQQRSEDGARDVDRVINELLTNPNPLERAEQFGSKYGYALQQGAQNFLDRVVWLGAYRQAEAAGVSDAQAVRDADAAVRLTQSSFAPEDAAAVEHANAFTRMFLMFYSYFSGQANMVLTEAVNAKGRPARLAVVYLLGFAIPAFVADVISKGLRGQLGDDEDEDLAEQMLDLFFTSQLRYALAMAPVAGQAGNVALGQFTPERFDDRIGASPTYSAIEATVRAPRSIYRAIEGDGNPKTAVRDGLTAVSLLTGVQVGWLGRPLGHLADEDADEVTLRGLMTGSAK